MKMGAHIIQMSNSYWVYELVQIIKEEQPSFEHPILNMTREESLYYIREHIKNNDLSQFLSSVEFEN